ncbi:MAG: FGGY-family carbohydrate kinase [Clostridia bacterium]|nr:FGGY-family carbohydrate kinase [Clostridia bacterium]
MDIKTYIEEGKAVLGIEFGSTRIKGVLIDDAGEVLAVGGYEWENSLVNGIWTYGEDEFFAGLKGCYATLKQDVKEKYGITLKNLKAIGISGMMHGYLAFDADGKLLAPFRTWRNTCAGEAANKLTELFQFNIPDRWSIAHLYQVILDGEEHVKDVCYFTTLAGYIHTLLTGEKVLGIGEASGMFPMDGNNYSEAMLDKFDALVADKGYPWKIREILPQVLVAGENAGALTAEGAKLLDSDGDLQAGIPMCPPEGDAGTGMVATNSVRVRTGNVSAGTSVFAMIVLEKMLSKLYREIDMVTTPDGAPVAMVHCNNCTSDINAWTYIFKEVLDLCGAECSMGDLFTALFKKSAEADADCGNLISYNYFSGEFITGFETGKPLFIREPDSKFSLANFMRVQLFTAFGGIKIGMNILEKENVAIDKILGHGGFFKTPVIGQSVLAAAMNAPVSVMETAGEGGAWGVAVLAAYSADKEEGETLPDYLDNKIFATQKMTTLEPDTAIVDSFNRFMENYKKGLSVERAAVEM